MFRVYTKLGDKGESSLADGSRVPKNHRRLDAYGSLDELLASLGILVSLLPGEAKLQGSAQASEVKSSLERVQNELFAMSSEIAHPNYDKAKNKSFLVLEAHIKKLENEIDAWEKELEPLRNFILPGSHPLSSYAHMARTICRRGERKLVSLGEEESLREEPLRFLNRLSDWLFVLGRFLDHLVGAQEKVWSSS